MKVSIVIPIYNSEKYLRRCIDSILSQTYSNIEIILVDDGSTDTSKELCQEYATKDKRIITIFKNNQGVSNARNSGINIATGKLLTFCDSDDWVEPTWIEDYIKNFQGEDMLIQNSIWHYPNKLFKRSIFIDKKKGKGETIRELYERNMMGYVWSTLYKKEIIDIHNINFNETYNSREDLNFNLKYCLYANSIKVLSCRNYHYIFPTTTKRYQLCTPVYIDTLVEEANLIYQLIPDDRILNSQIIISNLILNAINNIYNNKEYTYNKIALLRKIKLVPFKIKGTNFNHKLSCIILNKFPPTTANILLTITKYIKSTIILFLHRKYL